MFEHRKIQGLNDFFMELDSRKEKGVYFYRINGFLWKSFIRGSHFLKLDVIKPMLI